MPVTRPSTANTTNTMCLVLKPKQDELYTHHAPLLGSESEREAWRKNRVIQMKLGAYLTEVQMQQQSCSRLMKTAEYRFMQEATRRSGVPRSVEMLQQLHCYRQKHFPRARYAYGTSPPRDGHHHHGVHKHPPLSARPVRPVRQTNGFNRPKTSATLYRKNSELDDDRVNDMSTHGYPGRIVNEAPMYRGDVNRQNDEQVFDLGSENIHQQQQPSRIPHPSLRHTTELPAINLKENNPDDVYPSETFTASTPRKPSTSIDTCRKLANDTIRSVSLPRTPFTTKQRTDSITSAMAKYTPPMQRMNSNSKFITPELSFHPQEKCAAEVDRESVESLNNDTDVIATFTEYDDDRVFDNEFDPSQADKENRPKAAEADLPLIDFNDHQHDENLVDFDDNFGPEMTPNEKQEVKKTQKALQKKTSFNRIRTEPVMPLRHNITSVLRQERRQYEANQLKVKDYIHKMASRDTLSRPNPRELSAQSRKSSARMNDSRTDSKVFRKT